MKHQNKIKGEKIEIGNPKHIALVKKFNRIYEGKEPVLIEKRFSDRITFNCVHPGCDGRIRYLLSESLGVFPGKVTCPQCEITYSLDKWSGNGYFYPRSRYPKKRTWRNGTKF